MSINAILVLVNRFFANSCTYLIIYVYFNDKTQLKLTAVIAYLKKIQKCINHVTYPLSSADISIFSLNISKFCYIKNYRYKLHFNAYFVIALVFFESLKVFLINMVAVLMMSAKLVTQGLLKTKVF